MALANRNPHFALRWRPTGLSVSGKYASYPALAGQHTTGAGYVLFTQASSGARWKNALAPYLLSSSRPAPFIETDAQGYAIEASPAGDIAGLNVDPGQIEKLTAASLDGTSAAVKSPGDLAPARRGVLPGEAADRVGLHREALRDIRSGLRPEDRRRRCACVLQPYGAAEPYPAVRRDLRDRYPGYYSSSQTLTSAEVWYAEQFATYIPQGQQVDADASGIDGRG
jgi:hypothetical protein